MTNMRAYAFRMAVIAVALLAWSHAAAAHCDTLNGPVVSAARVALQQGNVTPVLKWIKATEEAEVREAFQRTMTVRRAGREAQELADLYFFETLVRLHRQGEGEPYTGLKPSADVDPAIEGADRALETGSIDDVVRFVTEQAAAGIRERFARAKARRSRADESVTAGREYVEAYIEFVHYIELLRPDAGRTGSERGAIR